MSYPASMQGYAPTNSIQLKEEPGEVFTFDEEPHLLPPETGFGFYALTLGQILNDGKYTIVRKLGWGQNSSVWLASVRSDADAKVKYVAIKVATVNETAGIVQDMTAEYKTYKLVTETDPDHPGYKHCVALQDRFVAESQHGPHVCFVTEPLGTTLDALRREQPNRVFSVPVVKKITKQTLLALDYLHRECKMVHTDVKPDNLLVSLCSTNPDEDIARYLIDHPSETYEPRVELDLSPDPIITVKSQPLPNFGLDPSLNNLVLKLADFGCTTPVGEHLLGDVAQPALLRAPEILLGHSDPWSTPVDIWSVGCLIFEYLVGTTLFEVRATPTISYGDVHLKRISEIVEPFPASFLEKCEHRAEFFDDKGSLLRFPELGSKSIEKCITSYKHVSIDEDDVAAVGSFMRRCLTIDPAARPSALELLQDDWFKGV